LNRGLAVRESDHRHMGSADGGIKVGIVMNRPRPATGTTDSARFGGRN
jgi:hypothetical protein